MESDVADCSDDGGVMVYLNDVKGQENCTKIQIIDGLDNPAICVKKDQFKNVAKEYFNIE